jgi:hypothetical protein
LIFVDGVIHAFILQILDGQQSGVEGHSDLAVELTLDVSQLKAASSLEPGSTYWKMYETNRRLRALAFFSEICAC